MVSRAEFVRGEDQCYLHLTLDAQQVEDMRKFWKCFAQLRYFHYQAVLKTQAFHGQ